MRIVTFLINSVSLGTLSQNNNKEKLTALVVINISNYVSLTRPFWVMASCQLYCIGFSISQIFQVLLTSVALVPADGHGHLSKAVKTSLPIKLE